MGMIEGITEKFLALEESKKVASFIDGKLGNKEVFCVKGLFGSSKGCFLSSVIKSSSSSHIHLVVEDSKEAAEYMCSDLYSAFDGEVFYFPSLSSSSAKLISIKDTSNKVHRSMALSAINKFGSENKDIVIVAYPDSIKEMTVSRQAVAKSLLSIKKGDIADFENLKETLSSAGFEKVDFVSEPGQFAIRGGIVDIFSYSDNVPYRIDFFGNEVESISRFNTDTQRSSERTDIMEVFPNLQTNSAVMAYGGQDIFSYIGAENCIIWHDTFEQVQNMYEGYRIISLNGRKPLNADSGKTVFNTELSCSPQPSFHKNFSLLADDIRKRNSEGYKVYISSSSIEQIERIKSIFNDSSYISQGEYPYFEYLENPLHEGFVCADIKICVYTDHQIFERYHRVKIKRQVERSERLALEDIAAFHIGDYVVHIDHGVGVFGGLVKTNIGGRLREAIKIIYRERDLIFVSVHSLHKISKYKSKDGTPPKIYRLGSTAWNKLKTTTKAKIKDIAKDLISLYSQRKQIQGFAFSPIV